MEHSRRARGNHSDSFFFYSSMRLHGLKNESRDMGMVKACVGSDSCFADGLVWAVRGSNDSKTKMPIRSRDAILATPSCSLDSRRSITYKCPYFYHMMSNLELDQPALVVSLFHVLPHSHLIPGRDIPLTAFVLAAALRKPRRMFASSPPAELDERCWWPLVLQPKKLRASHWPRSSKPLNLSECVIPSL